jgi:hypothetical protein
MDGLLVVKLSEVIRQVCIDSVVRTCAVFSTYKFLDFTRLGYRYRTSQKDLCMLRPLVPYRTFMMGHLLIYQENCICIFCTVRQNSAR